MKVINSQQESRQNHGSHQDSHQSIHEETPHGSHHHSHIQEDELRGRKLLWVTVLNFSITLVQIVGGILSNSLALISDALHNLGDSSAIFIAFLAGKKAQKAPDNKKTYGYKRIEILAALFNAIVLIAICLYLFIEAYKRFAEPEEIKGPLMLIVALFGLVANVISVIILRKDKAHNVNVKAAYMHLMGDTLSSVAVIVGGFAIWFWDLYWIDPLITTLVGIYIIWHTWGIVKQTVNILMQGTPEWIDISEVERNVEAIDGVADMHHIHIWNLDDSKTFLEAHLAICENIRLSDAMSVKQKVEELLQSKFDIQHITLQIELTKPDGSQPCTH